MQNRRALEHSEFRWRWLIGDFAACQCRASVEQSVCAQLGPVLYHGVAPSGLHWLLGVGTSMGLRFPKSPSPRGTQMMEQVARQHFHLPHRAIKSHADIAAGVCVCSTSGCTRAIFMLES